MSMCRVFSCVVGRGCLLWPVCSLGKTVYLKCWTVCLNCLSKVLHAVAQWRCIDKPLGRTDAETPALRPPDMKSWLTCKARDAGKDWPQKEKGLAEDEMVRKHHALNGHEFEQTPGDSEGQGSFACYSLCGLKESNMTEWLNNNKDKNTQKSTDEVFVILKLAV